MNKEVPSHVEQVPQGRQGVKGAQVPPQGYPIPNVKGGIEVLDMSIREIREALIGIARAMTMQANLSMMPRVLESSTKTRLRNFVKMNPPIHLVSKVGDDTYEFLIECIRC